jgi:hypothetical protein
MAVDFIGNSGVSLKLTHSEMIDLRQAVSGASAVIETDILYSEEEAAFLCDKLLPYKKETLVRKFIAFLKKSKGFIIY